MNEKLYSVFLTRKHYEFARGNVKRKDNIF